MFHDSMNRPKMNLLLYLHFILSVKYQFSPNLAGFPDISNEIRHNGGFKVAKMPNFRHGDA